MRAAIASFGIIFVALACGSFSDASPDPSTPDGGTDPSPVAEGGPAGDADVVVDTGKPEAASTEFCTTRTTAIFCNDFEADPFGVGWTDREQFNASGGLLSLTSTSDRAMAIAIPSTGSEVRDFWYRDITALPTSFTVSFSLRGNNVIPDGEVEIAEVSSSVGGRAAGIRMTNGQLMLYVVSTTPSANLSKPFGPIPTSSTRIRVIATPTKITAKRPDGFQDAEIEVDAGILTSAMARFSLGLVYTQKSVGGQILVDDALIEAN